MPDGVLMEGGKLVRSSGDRVAMCRHLMLDVERGIAVELAYARVLLVDWERLDGVARALIQRSQV